MWTCDSRSLEKNLASIHRREPNARPVIASGSEAIFRQGFKVKEQFPFFAGDRLIIEYRSLD